MDSSDDEDDRHAAALGDSQLDDVDDDAMNALLEEEIAAAMQADSDDLNDDEEAKQPNDNATERKEGSRNGTSGRRGINGDLFGVDNEEKDSGGARKRPARESNETKAGEVDSDIEETGGGEGRGEQSKSASASHGAATASSAAQQSASKRRTTKENYQRREQRRRQLDIEHNNIRASLPSKEARQRYETFRRARLSHSTIKSLIQQCTGWNKVEGQLPSVLSAMGRVYVGLIVEEARRAMRAMGHDGNIRPMHLREAHRRLADRGDIVVPNCSDGRKRALGVAGWRRNGQFFREMG